MQDNPKPSQSTATDDNPPVRMARTQEEMNALKPKPKRGYVKKPKTETLSDEKWAEQMRKFINVKGNSPMTLEEIATVMGITREYVRQIEAVALKKLRRALEARDIMEFKDVSPETHYSSGMMNSERYRED